MTTEEKLARVLELLRAAIWQEKLEEGYFARDVLTAINEPHGDEERQAERRRQWEADAPKRAAEARELRRISRLRKELEPVIATALMAKYKGVALRQTALLAMTDEANVIVDDYLRTTGEDDFGHPVVGIRYGDHPGDVGITWRRDR